MWHWDGPRLPFDDSLEMKVRGLLIPRHNKDPLLLFPSFSHPWKGWNCDSHLKHTQPFSVDGGIIKGSKTSQHKIQHTLSHATLLSSAGKPLCCLPAPLSQALVESLGFSLRLCSPTTSTELGKFYSRCAVPASSCCCFHAHGMEHFSKRKSHQGKLDRGVEKGQNSSFFLLSWHF